MQRPKTAPPAEQSANAAWSLSSTWGRRHEMIVVLQEAARHTCTQSRDGAVVPPPAGRKAQHDDTSEKWVAKAGTGRRQEGRGDAALAAGRAPLTGNEARTSRFLRFCGVPPPSATQASPTAARLLRAASGISPLSTKFFIDCGTTTRSSHSCSRGAGGAGCGTQATQARADCQSWGQTPTAERTQRPGRPPSPPLSRSARSPASLAGTQGQHGQQPFPCSERQP